MLPRALLVNPLNQHHTQTVHALRAPNLIARQRVPNRTNNRPPPFTSLLNMSLAQEQQVKKTMDTMQQQQQQLKQKQQVEKATTMSPPIHIPDSFKGYPISSFNLQHVPACDLESVLIPGGLVRDRIERLGYDISTDFAHDDFTFLCVLKGGFQFFNQLLEVVRQYHRFNIEQSMATDKAHCKARRIQAEFIRLISYEDDASKGDVKIIGLENLSSLRDKNVLIVEDIIDSGLTMQTLLKALEREKPRLIKVASLFFKRTPKNKGNYYPDYVGFSIPDSFIVGCNLDYNNYFRDLQHVCVISNEGKQRYKSVSTTNGCNANGSN